jgi:hypothetical protein
MVCCGDIRFQLLISDYQRRNEPHLKNCRVSRLVILNGHKLLDGKHGVRESSGNEILSGELLEGLGVELRFQLF